MTRLWLHLCLALCAWFGHDGSWSYSAGYGCLRCAHDLDQLDRLRARRR